MLVRIVPFPNSHYLHPRPPDRICPTSPFRRVFCRLPSLPRPRPLDLFSLGSSPLPHPDIHVSGTPPFPGPDELLTVSPVTPTSPLPSSYPSPRPSATVSRTVRQLLRNRNWGSSYPQYCPSRLLSTLGDGRPPLV